MKLKKKITNNFLISDINTELAPGFLPIPEVLSKLLFDRFEPLANVSIQFVIVSCEKIHTGECL